MLGPHAMGCSRGVVSVADVSLRSSQFTATPLCGQTSSVPFVLGIGSLAPVAVTSHTAVTLRLPSLLFWVAILGQTVTACSDSRGPLRLSPQWLHHLTSSRFASSSTLGVTWRSPLMGVRWCLIRFPGD